MVVIDAHSKWPEVFVMEGTTAEETFNTLFARLELPDQIVSDNGPQFTSEALGTLQLLIVLSLLLVHPILHLIETSDEPFYRFLSGSVG